LPISQKVTEYRKGHYSPFFFLHNAKECEKFHNMKTVKVITFNILASGQRGTPKGILFFALKRPKMPRYAFNGRIEPSRL